MNIDFKAEVVRIAQCKQATAELDTLGIYSWHLPKIAATQVEIERAKKITEFLFSDDYVEMLRTVNGWKGFLIDTDLFGIADFESGRHVAVMERQELKDFIDRIGLERQNVLVIGANDFDLDVFLLISRSAPILSEGVIWFAAQEVDRYESVGEFFSSMAKYNCDIAEKIRTESSQ